MTIKLSFKYFLGFRGHKSFYTEFHTRYVDQIGFLSLKLVTYSNFTILYLLYSSLEKSPKLPGTNTYTRLSLMGFKEQNVRFHTFGTVDALGFVLDSTDFKLRAVPAAVLGKSRTYSGIALSSWTTLSPNILCLLLVFFSF